MSDKSNQNISELMDGELSSDCSRFLLKRLQSDVELRSSWNNYHMLRSCLQKEHDAPLIQDLGSSVVNQLVQEQSTVSSPENKSPRGFFKALSGAAIAASVAMVAVFTFNTQQEYDQSHLGLDVVYDKTPKQLIKPPDAMVARVEQPASFSRYPSLTPQVQQYITESNNQPVIPVYYNTEYIKNMIIQTQLQSRKATADE